MTHQLLRLFHDKVIGGLDVGGDIIRNKSKENLFSKEVNEAENCARPVAPFTSEKLFLHNNLGADNFTRAAQGGTAAVRKEAAKSLHNNQHHFHHSNSKYSGYHAASKSHKHNSSYRRNSKRSKSAIVGSTGSSKLILPSLLPDNAKNNSAGATVVVPQLALTVTRSVNLPPIVEKSKSRIGCVPTLKEEGSGENFKKDIDFISDQAEQEGGILAPRKV